MDLQEILPDGKKMWRVEKFNPARCFHCDMHFHQEGRDWYRVIHDENHKIIETVGFLLCRCQGCLEQFQMVPLESWQVSDETEADRLCREEGFVNKTPCIAVGTATRDCHMVCQGGPTVKSLPCKEVNYDH